MKDKKLNFVSLDGQRKINLKKSKGKIAKGILIKSQRDFYVLISWNKKNQLILDFYKSKRGAA